MSPRPNLHKYGPDPRCLRFPKPIREKRYPISDFVWRHRKGCLIAVVFAFCILAAVIL